MVECNLIHEAHKAGAQRLLFLGSSCIYPKFAPQPIQEGSLLTSQLEITNEAYAVAKIAGVKLCQYYSLQYGRSYIAAMPTNLYGRGDNYHPTNSHVVPGLIRRFHEAKMGKQKEVLMWGTAGHYVNFSMSMIWPRRVYFFWINTTKMSISILGHLMRSLSWNSQS